MNPKIKTYVLMVSTKFPAYHPKKGIETDFPLKIKYYEKSHTIRGNFELWKKRFEKINRGEAVLSVRIWDGIPRKSKQLEIFKYNYTHKIGVQEICFIQNNIERPCIFEDNYASRNHIQEIAKNDGLSVEDFKEWFKKYDLNKPMAIIHFTSFRY